MMEYFKEHMITFESTLLSVFDMLRSQISSFCREQVANDKLCVSIEPDDDYSNTIIIIIVT